MKDSIKDYIDQNREAFDDQGAPDGLWESIESQLPEEKQEMKMVPLSRVWQIAAAAAILVAAAWVFSLRNDSDPAVVAEKPQEEQTDLTDAEINDRYPELEEAGFYYRTKIEKVDRELDEYALSEEDLESVRLLETELADLRRSLGHQPDDERVVEAMIGIYRHKLALLEELLSQLKNQHRNDQEDDINVVPL